MSNLIVYDNEGSTADRYTVITPTGNVYGMSDIPSHPQGVFIYCGTLRDFPQGLEHTGKLLKKEDIPSSLDVALCHGKRT